MDQQILLEIARLVSRQSTLLLAMTGMMLVGLVVMGMELYAIMRGLQDVAASVKAVGTSVQAVAASVKDVATSVQNVAQMTTEILRRMP
jgi:methyl-accepting chemotaxis protein